MSEDYKQGAELSTITVALVWILYLTHFALELFAAIRRFFPIRVAGLGFAILGAFLVSLGIILCVLGLTQLGSIRRMSGIDSSRLIKGGIYSWSRNPQNVGWGLFLFGIGLISHSVLAFFLALLFAVLFAFYLRMEENHLESVFGHEYQEYKENSHRFFGIPRNKDVR